MTISECLKTTCPVKGLRTLPEAKQQNKQNKREGISTFPLTEQGLQQTRT
jgi:hypothetical protein